MDFHVIYIFKKRSQTQLSFHETYLSFQTYHISSGPSEFTCRFDYLSVGQWRKGRKNEHFVCLAIPLNCSHLSVMTPLITGITIICLTAFKIEHRTLRKHQSSISLAICERNPLVNNAERIYMSWRHHAWENIWRSTLPHRVYLTSLTSGICDSSFKCAISEDILRINWMSSYEIVLMWILSNTYDDKSTLV